MPASLAVTGEEEGLGLSKRGAVSAEPPTPTPAHLCLSWNTGGTGIFLKKRGSR